MSQRDPAPAGDPTPPTTGPANTPPPPPGGTGGTAPEPYAEQPRTPHEPRQEPQQAPERDRAPAKDALKGTRTSHLWIALLLMVLVLVLLAVFILQNTQDVQVSYFGVSGQSPLAVALLIAFAAGLLVAGVAGTLRIWQLRRKVRKLDR